MYISLIGGIYTHTVSRLVSILESGHLSSLETSNDPLVAPWVRRNYI